MAWEHSKIDVVDDDTTVSGWLQKMKAFGSAQQRADAALIAAARADSVPERLRRAEATIAAAEAAQEASEQAQWDIDNWPEAEERDRVAAAKKLERERLQAHKAKVEKEAAYDQNSPEIKARLKRQADWDRYRADAWERFYTAEAEARANREPRPDEPNLPKAVPEYFATGHPTTRVLASVPLTPLAAVREPRKETGHYKLEPDPRFQYRVTVVKPEDLPHPEDQIAADAAKDRKHG